MKKNYNASAFSFKPNMKESLMRLQAFWNKEMADRPPIRIRYDIPGVNDEAWQQSCEKPDTHFAYWERMNSIKRELPDDDMLTAAVYHGPAFMGGVLGRPVIFGKGTSWNEHNFDYDMLPALKEIKFDESNKWIAFMKEQVDYFAEHADGKFTVGTNLFTGPGDIMGDVRGVSEMYLDLMLEPENVEEFAEICTKAYVETTQFFFDHIPSVEGGYCDYYSLWTPGRSCMLDDDLSVGVSPTTYHDMLFPYDVKCAESMDTAWMHTHSGQARLVPEFIKNPYLKAVQIVYDWPAGPNYKDLLSTMQLIQKNHCLLLRKFGPEELDYLLPQLRPDRLYVDTQVNTFEEAEQYLDKWDKMWK